MKPTHYAIAAAGALLILLWFLTPPKSAPIPLVPTASLERPWMVCKDAAFANAESEGIIRNRYEWGRQPFSGWCPTCAREDYSLDPSAVVGLTPLPKNSLKRAVYSGYIGPIKQDVTRGLGPVYSMACDQMEHLGEPGDDEERYVCKKDWSNSSSCVIFSIGSNNQYSFEEQVVNRLKSPCAIHTFDCTVHTPKPPDYVHFHPLCLGGQKEATVPGWGTLQDFVEVAGGKQPELLKIDIEGWEWIALVNLLESARVGNIYPDQIAIEIHFHDIPWSYGYFWERETTAYFNYFFYEHGYVVAYRRVNPVCRVCFEILLVRLKC